MQRERTSLFLMGFREANGLHVNDGASAGLEERHSQPGDGARGSGEGGELSKVKDSGKFNLHLGNGPTLEK